MRSVVPVVWTAVWLLAANGCGRYGTVDGGTDEPDADGWSCPALCNHDEDCCEGYACSGGVCRPGPDGCFSGCNYECDKAQGQRCDQGTLACIQGDPPLNCQTDCNCYTGERCVEGACLEACLDDRDCAAGLQCRDGVCRVGACASNSDCLAEGSCLVCRDQACVDEPAVCAGNQDCCEGRVCNFGVCVTLGGACDSDEDCETWEACAQGHCIPWEPDCLIDADCGACNLCVLGRCLRVDPAPCVPADCPLGTWCQPGGCGCEPGCDQDSDCEPPLRCSFATHVCGTPDGCGGICTAEEYCDTFTGFCVPLCDDVPACQFNDPPNCCPNNYTCDTQTGHCVCTDAACPAGTSCDPVTGSCMGDPCVPACVQGESCVCGVCRPADWIPNAQCFNDEECDFCGGSLLCDNDVDCAECLQEDPAFQPEFVCREACDYPGGSCSNAIFECRLRRDGPRGLCVPPSTP